MKKNIYLLEYIDYDYFDIKDFEDVEEKYIIGYFSSKKTLSKAKKICKEKEIIDSNLKVTKYEIEIGNNQKFLYILNYEYSIHENGIFIDYYYYFEPKSSKQKALQKIYELIKNPKYQDSPKKIYYNGKNGFFVDKIRIDFISHIDYFDVSEQQKKF